MQFDYDEGKGQAKLGAYMGRTWQSGPGTQLLDQGRASETGAEGGRITWHPVGEFT